MSSFMTKMIGLLLASS